MIIARRRISTRRIRIEQFIDSNRIDVCGEYVLFRNQESVNMDDVIRTIGDTRRVEIYGFEIVGWFGVRARKYENITSIPPT
jgi:hypothetical protein